MQIIKWIFKIFIYVSAFVCSIDRKNMILHMVVEFLYLVVILVLPVFVIAFFICGITGNKGIDLIDVGKYIGIGLFGWCYYYVFSNRKSDNNIEKYILKIALSFEEYYYDKQKVFLKNRHILLEYVNFVILLFFSIVVLELLSDTMVLNSINAEVMCIITGFLFAYVLYVYGNQDEIVREERKAYIGIVVTFIWLIVVVVRLNKYISDSIMINTEDAILLIFTFPTIFAWIKNISKKINSPYKDKV